MGTGMVNENITNVTFIMELKNTIEMEKNSKHLSEKKWTGLPETGHPGMLEHSIFPNSFFLENECEINIEEQNVSKKQEGSISIQGNGKSKSDQIMTQAKKLKITTINSNENTTSAAFVKKEIQDNMEKNCKDVSGN